MSTASLPFLNPSPYAVDESDSIWCLKNSPSFFSKSDRFPFLDEAGPGDGEEEEDDDDDDEGISIVEIEYISASNHMCPKTWQIPSSTSGLRLG